MNELTNTATVSGTYNDIPTSITSNTSVVNIIEGLTLTKQADQTNWSSGNLTYTITISNQTEKTYINPVITDVINTNLVSFINGSIKINDIQATEDKYEYNDATSTLTINLEDISPKSISTLTFLVKKKD